MQQNTKFNKSRLSNIIAHLVLYVQLMISIVFSFVIPITQKSQTVFILNTAVNIKNDVFAKL